MNYSRPKNKKELQRFLGCINYDRKFIPKITKIIQPLYKLLDKDVKFEWLEYHTTAFENVKKQWSNSLELDIPDFSKHFTLDCDASDSGISAVLTQNLKPVAYISRALKKAEKHCSITERKFSPVVGD
jgi:hypothetical protein